MSMDDILLAAVWGLGIVVEFLVIVALAVWIINQFAVKRFVDTELAKHKASVAAREDVPVVTKEVKVNFDKRARATTNKVKTSATPKKTRVVPSKPKVRGMDD